MISRLFSREPETRIFFATDIHGSEVCWRKFLNAGKHYEADIMVLGGDMTGKALVPIVEEGWGAGAHRYWRIGTILRPKKNGTGVRRCGPTARLLPVPHRPG